MTLELVIAATDGAARTGLVRTARGEFRTPCFMPVGTRGTVRATSPADLEDLGAEVMLANTYHLMLRPGTDIVEAAGGLHRFAGWPGHILTDSGGYQVFSLDPKVDDAGVTFRSTYDGSTHRLTPEDAVTIQERLGADIQMVLDVCVALPAPTEVVRRAVERTAEWARRAKASQRRTDQALFGIVQGGVDEALRTESAERTVELDFPGYAIGGLSVGESREELLATLDVVVPLLPPDRPRYLMGVGDPVGLVEAIARGVDMFDCVLPTRLARHGTILTAGGRLSLRNAAHQDAAGPLDDSCSCPVCGRWSRAYLRHLLMVGEPAAARLLTLHNLTYILTLVREVRQAIQEGRLEATRRQVAEAWG